MLRITNLRESVCPGLLHRQFVLCVNIMFVRYLRQNYTIICNIQARNGDFRKEEDKTIFPLLLPCNYYFCRRTIKYQGMNTTNIDFATYCIGNLSRRLGISSHEVYQRLKSSGILTEYIIPSYDVLHTFSKEYLLEDLTEYMKEKGVLP